MIGLEYLCYLRRLEYKIVAEKIGVSPATIQDWLKGRRKIPDQRLDQLSIILEVDKEVIQTYTTEEIERELRIRELKREAKVLGFGLV